MPDECLTGSVWDDRGPPDRFSNAAGCQEVCAASGLYTQQLKRLGWPERRSVGLVCGQRGDVLIFPGCSRNTRLLTTTGRPRLMVNFPETRRGSRSFTYLRPRSALQKMLKTLSSATQPSFFDDVAKRQWCDSQVSGRLPPPNHLPPQPCLVMDRPVRPSHYCPGCAQFKACARHSSASSNFKCTVGNKSLFFLR